MPSQEPTKARSEKRQKQAVIAARLTPQELTQVRAEASRQGVSVSELVRTSVIAVTA